MRINNTLPRKSTLQHIEIGDQIAFTPLAAPESYMYEVCMDVTSSLPEEQGTVDMETSEDETFIVQDPQQATFIIQEPEEGTFIVRDPQQDTFLIQDPEEGTIIVLEPEEDTFTLQNIGQMELQNKIEELEKLILEKDQAKKVLEAQVEEMNVKRDSEIRVRTCTKS